MLEYLKKCKNPVIITDNHLSCDIPNNYNVILVHHGVAKTQKEMKNGINVGKNCVAMDKKKCYIIGNQKQQE